MCGRFALTQTDPVLLAESFDLPQVPELAPRYNVAPTQSVATVLVDEQSQQRVLARMTWGLIPSWAKERKIGNRMINARGETVHEKPSFRAAFRRRRCLVLADGFYEWQAAPADSGQPKQPMFIYLDGQPVFGMAGLYEYWTDPDSGEIVVSTTIITTEANSMMAEFHHRMPVILPRSDYVRWLDPQQQDPLALRSLLTPYPAEQMRYHPVSRRVNSPANDDASLVQPA